MVADGGGQEGEALRSGQEGTGRRWVPLSQSTGPLWVPFPALAGSPGTI